MTGPPKSGREDDPRSEGYRLCAGITLFNRDGQVWVGQRTAFSRPAWQMPQGGIDAGETPRQAALRELGEEIGLATAEVLAEAPGWLRYDFPSGINRGRHRGQAQRWFALLHRGGDDAFDLQAHHPPEFSAWRWVALEAAVALVVPFKRPVYRAVAAAFGHLPEQIRAGTFSTPLPVDE
jgi:putative (di)nucleoside polyphosphate hydrolase